MIFYLSALRKYKKRAAKRRNSFKAFDPSKDRLVIDISRFGGASSSNIYFARSKKAFRRAKKSGHLFVYDKRNGLLFYNKNGAKNGFGKGGVVALFSKNLSLKKKSFRILDQSPSLSISDPALMTDAVFAFGPRPM